MTFSASASQPPVGVSVYEKTLHRPEEGFVVRVGSLVVELTESDAIHLAEYLLDRTQGQLRETLIADEAGLLGSGEHSVDLDRIDEDNRVVTTNVVELSLPTGGSVPQLEYGSRDVGHIRDGKLITQVSAPGDVAAKDVR